MMFNEESILEIMSVNKDGAWAKQYVALEKEMERRDKETTEPIPFDETSEADKNI